MRNFTIVLLTMFITLGVAYAHQGAKGIVKVRMDAMSAIGKSMKVISETLSGKREFDGALISQEANIISGHARVFPDHFKEKTNDKLTEASPKIWEDPATFKKLSNDLANYAKRLSENASINSDLNVLKADFKIIGGTCKDCHADFRVKKQ